MAHDTMNFIFAMFNAFIFALAWVFAYTGLPVEPSVILGVLMLVDILFGLASAKVAKAAITSHRLTVGMLSKATLLTIPLVMALAAKGLGADFYYLVNWIVYVFILSEVYSIVSNAYTIKTGKQAPEWDAISFILARLRVVIENLDKR